MKQIINLKYQQKSTKMTHHLQNKKIKTVLLALLLGLSGTANLVAQNITFADANVKAICVEPETGWDNNGDGELSYAEAAAVTSIGTVFKGKTNIQSFNELQHFISLTAIDERAFMGCTALAEITIPENIATIGDKAFVNCPALATVHFNAINCTSMSTIYNNENYSAFMSNQTTFPLANLTIGSNVQNIPDYAFRGCNQIQNLTIPASVTTVGDYAFYECTDLETLITGGGAIGEYAFHSCTSLETLTIGEGVTSIGHCAFWDCPVLTTVHFNATNCATMGDIRDEGNWFEVGPYEPQIWRPYYVMYSVFRSGPNYNDPSPITTLTIGNNVTRIPACAFYGCSGLTGSLTIPNSVSVIDDHAFGMCAGFTGNLILGNSVTTIGAGAFQGCNFTGNLNIPNSVIHLLGWTAHFYHPYFGDIIDEIDASYGAFAGCSGFTGDLIIPNSVTDISDNAFRGCSGFTGSLNIPNSVTSIGYGAFASCSGFTGNLIIPNSVTTINDYAFYGCTGFTGSLNIPNSVAAINDYAFYGCTGFTGSLNIPNSVTIGQFAFSGCTGFKGSLIISKSMWIGYDAFRGCSGFDGALILDRNVTLYDGAFAECSGFTALITETPSKPSAYGHEYMLPSGLIESSFGGIFWGMNQNIPVYVPAGHISDYQNDEQGQWSYFTNYVNQVKFEQDSNDQWSDEFNWPSWEVPTSTDVVCITDNCQLDVDANVLYVYIADDEKVLTVNSGKTLNTTYGVHIENASQLMVEDGAQTISDIPFSGTVQKHIDAYTSNDDGWNFIASPVTEGQSISGLIPTGGTVYDLYYLDEENTYWRNYKVNAFDINHKQGYLYGNQAGTTINFSGTMQPYVAEGVSVPLTKEGAGWNLVGNPFTFNAYANKPYYVINGRNVEAATSGAIAPCTGIVVKANGTENEAVTFTKDAPAGSSNTNHGSLQIALTEANTRSVSQIDNAIVSFNTGETLPKFRFGDNAQIYLPQGNEDYAIACAEKTGELPLNFKAAKNGEYTLTVNPEDVEMEYLHLIDNMTGADVDLLATPTYTFNAKTTDYASRFRLVFSANSVSENADSDNEAFAFVSNGEIVFTNAEAGATLQIVDMMGRIVVSSDVARNVSTSDIPAGVYVLRLINGDNVRTQKMMIE